MVGKIEYRANLNEPIPFGHSKLIVVLMGLLLNDGRLSVNNAVLFVHHLLDRAQVGHLHGTN